MAAYEVEFVYSRTFTDSIIVEADDEYEAMDRAFDEASWDADVIEVTGVTELG